MKKVVNDNIYQETLQRVKKFIVIRENPEKYLKKILINLMPTFALKQLVIFIKLGEYLKQEGFFVDYFICHGLFSHCDMVKMNDEIDRKLLCQRCIYADEFLKLEAFPVSFSSSSYTFGDYLSNATKRFCGSDIKFEQYILESNQNLKQASELVIDSYDFFISLNHFENYSIAPIYDRFSKTLLVGLDTSRLILNGGNKNKMCEYKISFDKNLENKIKNYLIKGMKKNKKFKRNSSKKVVTIFPNLLEDAFEKESNIIFKNSDEWLIQTVEFLLKNDFYVIVKAHPNEKKWKPFKSVLDLFKPNKNLLLLSADTSYSNFDLVDISEYIVTYNGTIFYEAVALEKKVVLAGKICEIYHSTKEEYFNQFFSYQTYPFSQVMKVAFIILFTKAIKLEMLNETLPYPHIKDEATNEIAFEIIKKIINEDYKINEYMQYFENLY